jgi:transcription elongation factor Elf1
MASRRTVGQSLNEETMTTEFACPRCKSNDFVRLERISVDSTGKATAAADAGYRCVNCQQRIDIDEQNTITPIDSPMPGHGTVPTRVRTSVTAEERGVQARRERIP